MNRDREKYMLNNLTILVVCVYGASSSILINKMKENEKPGENWSIDARGLVDLENIIAKYDVVLVSPQIKYAYESIVEQASIYGDIHVVQIPPALFVSADGGKNK